MFSIREVEYVLKVAQTKSISGAAKLCNVSQPALTMQLNKLEDHLGFKIFERSKNNNIATPKGRELLVCYQEILLQYQKIRQINQSQDQLRLGIIPTVAPYLLPKVIKYLSSLQKQFYFFEQQTELALNNLQNGDLDLVILAFYPQIIPGDLIYKKLYNEELFFVTNKSVNVSAAEGVKSDKVILLAEGNCINKSISGICQMKKLVNDNDFSATSIEVVKAMIATNNGYGILPKLTLGADIKNFNVKSFKPGKYREVGICYRPNFVDKNFISKLIEIRKLVTM